MYRPAKTRFHAGGGRIRAAGLAVFAELLKRNPPALTSWPSSATSGQIYGELPGRRRPRRPCGRKPGRRRTAWRGVEAPEGDRYELPHPDAGSGRAQRERPPGAWRRFGRRPARRAKRSARVNRRQHITSANARERTRASVPGAPRRPHLRPAGTRRASVDRQNFAWCDHASTVDDPCPCFPRGNSRSIPAEAEQMIVPEEAGSAHRVRWASSKQIRKRSGRRIRPKATAEWSWRSGS